MERFVEHPSPLQYFRPVVGNGPSLGVLERKAAAPYSVMREAAVFAAAAAINNGIVSVQDYVPLLHGALINLGQFGLSIVTASHYSALTWPNVELRDFANSIVDLGINMSYHTGSDSCGSMPASKIRDGGFVLKQFGLALWKMAGNTYFCQQDLSGVVVANQPSFQLSAAVVNGLVVEAMTANSSNTEGRPEHLSSLVGTYVKNQAHYLEQMNMGKRGTKQ